LPYKALHFMLKMERYLSGGTMKPSDATTTQEARLDFRLTRDVKRTIEQAAAVRGQSLTDFALSTLYEKAKRVLEEESMRSLSNRDRDIFLQMLDDTTRKPNQALRRAAARYKRTANARRRRTSVA
jgi:uncharacterized protein (DUF1778 family)